MSFFDFEEQFEDEVFLQDQEIIPYGSDDTLENVHSDFVDGIEANEELENENQCQEVLEQLLNYVDPDDQSNDVLDSDDSKFDGSKETFLEQCSSIEISDQSFNQNEVEKSEKIEKAVKKKVSRGSVNCENTGIQACFGETRKSKNKSQKKSDSSSCSNTENFPQNPNDNRQSSHHRLSSLNRIEHKNGQKFRNLNGRGSQNEANEKSDDSKAYLQYRSPPPFVITQAIKNENLRIYNNLMGGFQYSNWGQRSNLFDDRGNCIRATVDLPKYVAAYKAKNIYYFDLIHAHCPSYVRTLENGLEIWRMNFNVYSSGFGDYIVHLGEIHAFYQMELFSQNKNVEKIENNIDEDKQHKRELIWAYKDFNFYPNQMRYGFSVSSYLIAETYSNFIKFICLRENILKTFPYENLRLQKQNSRGRVENQILKMKNRLKEVQILNESENLPNQLSDETSISIKHDLSTINQASVNDKNNNNKEEIFKKNLQGQASNLKDFSPKSSINQLIQDGGDNNDDINNKSQIGRGETATRQKKNNKPIRNITDLSNWNTKKNNFNNNHRAGGGRSKINFIRGQHGGSNFY